MDAASCGGTVSMSEQSTDHPLPFRVRQHLTDCSNAVVDGDVDKLGGVIGELVSFLDSILDGVASNPDDEDARSNAFQVLSEIHRYICSPTVDQDVVDKLSFEFPKAASKFALVSNRCLDIVGGIIDQFIATCDTQDMFFILCKALVFIAKGDYIFRCFPLVIRLTNFFQHCGLSYLGLITGSAVDSITKIAIGEDEDDYTTSLAYVRQGASLSVVWGHVSDEVAQAAKEDLITLGNKLRSTQTKRWQAVGMLKYIFSSANLPWTLKKHAINFLRCITEGDKADKCDDEQSDGTSCMPSLFYAFQKRAIDFLLCITEGDDADKCDDELSDCTYYLPSLFDPLQAIAMAIMYSHDAKLRKNAFHAFKKVLADIPTYQRCDILKAFISNNDSSSMVAILIDFVKEEMCAGRDRFSLKKDESLQADKKVQNDFLLFELVELVLRPPKGGHPSLPEQADLVMSALSLYRFALIYESTGKTNYTGVLSKSNLQKAYDEWLLPLRPLVAAIVAENKNSYNQLPIDIRRALNPMEFVLHRCIELVEENMKISI